jgi:hypothetical protein
MMPNYIIQKFWDIANSSNTDAMRWSDFLSVMTELKNTDTTAYTENNVNFSGLPEYADDAAAVIGGLADGDLYRTSTGVLMVRLPDV